MIRAYATCCGEHRHLTADWSNKHFSCPHCGRTIISNGIRPSPLFRDDDYHRHYPDRTNDLLPRLMALAATLTLR